MTDVIDQSFEKAAKSIKQLLQQLDIRHVISVDDAYRATPDSICDALLQHPERAAEIPELSELDPHEPQDVLREKARRALGNTSAVALELIQRKLANGGTYRDDDLYRLAKLFRNDDVSYESMSLAAWRATYNDLSMLGAERRTLVLFDENFQDEGEASDAGLREIQRLMKETASERVLTGLLTSTCEPGEECHRWEKVASERSIDRNRFLYIAKKRLVEDVMGFALMLKLTALSPGCNTLLTKLCQLAEESVTEAAAECKKNVTIYDFEHIVFALSRSEGVWEPETVLRILQIYLRLVVARKVREQAEVRTLLEQVRVVSQIETDIQNPTPHTSWKIQRLEMYEDASVINQAHMPLDLGDIFVRPGKDGGKDRTFIVIAQPCDLMVRGNGKRQGRGAEEVVLCEIEDSHSTGSFELQYWNSNDGKSGYVNLAARTTIAPAMLDLAVLSGTGETVMKLNDVAPTDLVPSWRQRFDLLKNQVEQIIRNHTELKRKNVSDQLARLVIPTTSLDGKLRATVDVANSSLSLGFRRIGRLRQPWSGALLKQYAWHYAREAYEMDLGRELGN